METENPGGPVMFIEQTVSLALRDVFIPCEKEEFTDIERPEQISV
jgi:hypothetical protein